MFRIQSAHHREDGLNKYCCYAERGQLYRVNIYWAETGLCYLGMATWMVVEFNSGINCPHLISKPMPLSFGAETSMSMSKHPNAKHDLLEAQGDLSGNA